jgi:DNA replication protein DnaC
MRSSPSKPGCAFRCSDCWRGVQCQECRACDFFRAQRRGKCFICEAIFDRGNARPETCGAKACKIELLRRSIPTKLTRLGVPKRYQSCRFENFDAPPSLRKKVESLQRLAESKLARGVFLFGPVGAGKTHIAVSLLAEQLMRGSGGCFVRSMDFSSQCRNAFRPENDTTVGRIVCELLEHDILVFDDLGADKSSEFLRESLLNLFDQAYCDEKPVIVTSNRRIEQVNEIEPRLASRIAEMCLPVEMAGPDFRIRKANDVLRKGVNPDNNRTQLTESAFVPEGR